MERRLELAVTAIVATAQGLAAVDADQCGQLVSRGERRQIDYGAISGSHGAALMNMSSKSEEHSAIASRAPRDQYQGRETGESWQTTAEKARKRAGVSKRSER